MRTIRTVMATTHIDRHNERLAPSALRSLKAHIDSAYLPFIIEHDPRCPPIGRVVSAELTNLDDGELAIEGTVQVFEGGDDVPFDATRPVRYPPLNPDTLVLTVDRTFEQEQFKAPVAAIAKIFGSIPVHESKKALDPIAILGICLGAVAVGKFAGAFFSKLGSNTADALSAHLKDVFRRHGSDQLPLLRFQFEFTHHQRACRAELIATGPTDSDIDQILNDGLVQIDKLLPECLAANATRYVFEYSNGRAVLKFAVRSDAVPLFPQDHGEA